MKSVLAFFAVLALAASVRAAVPVKEDTLKCDACKLGFWAIEEFISSNKTESEISKLLGGLCNILPEPYQTSCKTTVETEVKELIEIAKAIESPDEVCVQLGACNDPLPVPDPECAACQYLVKDVERWVEENKTMSEIKHLVDSICLLMPSSWEQSCKQVADMGIEKIVELVLKYENPKVICEQLGICEGSWESSMAAFKCEACEIVFDALEKFVAANKSETEIEKLLDNICSLLGEKGQAVCDKIMDIGVKEAIKLLEELETPFEICRQIGACLGPEPEENISCRACKYLMADIEDWIASGKTVEEIETLVNNLCELMGDSWVPVCETIADTTVEVVIEMLVKFENPEVVCKQLGTCPSDKSEA